MASAQDRIEIRSPVFDGTDIDAIGHTYGDNTTLIINAAEFAAFYYDPDDNVTLETLYIRDIPGTEVFNIGLIPILNFYINLVASFQSSPIRFPYFSFQL